MVSIAILLAVFVLIAVRQVGNIRLQIWQVMLLGALGVFFTGQISIGQAAKSINPDVMLFLFGVFIIGQALEDSGYLSHLSYRFFSRAKSLSSLVLLVLFGMGFLSAFLMNDTLAIIGTPVVLSLARKTDTQPKILLLSLAFAITIGSAMSPIGNPQNLLVAIHGSIANPFVTFFRFLLAPTIVNLLLAYLMLRLFYRRHFHSQPLNHSYEPIQDPCLAQLCKASLLLLVGLVIVKIALVFLNIRIDFRLTYVALASAFPIVALSQHRLRILKRIDWHTLIFFAAMFVLMESVWNSGFFQSAINATGSNLASVSMILVISTLLSQLISNVPLVALYLPVLVQLGSGTREMIALAAGSTIAGNLSILGAASNVIIIHNAEKKSGATLSFVEFVRIGAPLTAVNAMVYWVFLRLV
ncbi:MAG: anion transporter [Chloroflexi bacterium]|nr:anion transporter [Chloroflexota bacterium]